MTAAGTQQRLVDQIDRVLGDFKHLEEAAHRDDLSDVPEHQMMGFLTRARAAIYRIAGRPSAYADQCEYILEEKVWHGRKAIWLGGVLQSLRSDVEAGYLASHAELIHGELFADFLEMSQHLLDEGYKDAAAVIAGSSLEAHLRQLCQKAGIDTETRAATSVSPKKADRLNSDLARANVYSKLDQKNVTAWLDLRNKAAHGLYQEYHKDQVSLLISSIRDFITRNPA